MSKKPSSTFICHGLCRTCPALSAWMWVCLLPRPGPLSFLPNPGIPCVKFLSENRKEKERLWRTKVKYHATKNMTHDYGVLRECANILIETIIKRVFRWHYVVTDLSPCVHESEAGLPCRGRFCCLSYCSFPSSSRSAPQVLPGTHTHGLIDKVGFNGLCCE